MKTKITTILATLFIAQSAIAGTETTNITTTATVNGTCNLNVSNVNLGDFNPFVIDNTNYPLVINYLCSQGMTAAISLQGDPVMKNSNNSDTLAARILYNNFIIFAPSNSIYPRVNGMLLPVPSWDSRTSDGTLHVTGNGSWQSNSQFFFRRPSANVQNFGPGNYSTTMTVLVTY